MVEINQVPSRSSCQSRASPPPPPLLHWTTVGAVYYSIFFFYRNRSGAPSPWASVRPRVCFSQPGVWMVMNNPERSSVISTSFKSFESEPDVAIRLNLSSNFRLDAGGTFHFFHDNVLAVRKITSGGVGGVKTRQMWKICRSETPHDRETKKHVDAKRPSVDVKIQFPVVTSTLMRLSCKRRRRHGVESQEMGDLTPPPTSRIHDSV